MAAIGVTIIGRNEGERLGRCLHSLDPAKQPIVYVDSGSTDGSVGLAYATGVGVAELDLSVPFTAARARNAGWVRLAILFPEIEFVQFVDGDCEVAPGWLEKAEAALRADPKIAVVAGRRRERHPEASVYNRLCDIEWDTPIGEAGAVGGDSMIRVSALIEAEGFDPTIVAGEEPDLCIRLRRAGWKIGRIDAEMTLHDAAMTRFRQWWKRCVRCGFGYALGAKRHRWSPEKHYRRECRRAIWWGFLFPTLLLAAAWPSCGWSLLGFLVYPIQMARIARRTRNRPVRDRLAYGIACMASKLPEFVGLCRFRVMNWRGEKMRIIEYK